ncbi:hypothetical protein SELMODRAFT_414169 [Selaginella moellendorffii]|uniref:Uncharacterized protein n=1 Tax=Selaginella moellendorffii TaxID=88036 RepID=D8RRW0_SELML|nr:hypothetical protein SELMODRAFT_414169 [Selaginella moellendorffii]
MKHTLLSYGSALALYSTLLREMIQSAKDCGYSPSEVADFQRDINDRIKSALNQVMFDALSKLVKEGGEFKYPSMASVAMSLFQISAGVMNFHTEWHNGAACLIAKSHEYYADCDLVDTKAHYQLNFRPKVGVEKNFYAMPQVFVSGRPAIHIYTKPEQEIQVAHFVFEEDNVDMKFRAYYMVDGDDYDSWEVLVNLSSYSNPQELQFTLSKRQSAIVSFPWVKMYYSNTEGGAWSTHYDKFSTNMRVYYDEYNSFKPENGRSYTITTKMAVIYEVISWIFWKYYIVIRRHGRKHGRVATLQATLQASTRWRSASHNMLDTCRNCQELPSSVCRLNLQPICIRNP